MEKTNIGSIAQKIKTIRTKLNMSQDRFGKKFGVSGKTVSAYERGTCIPPLKVLEKIALEYDTSFTSLPNKRREEFCQKINKVRQVLLEIEEKFL